MNAFPSLKADTQTSIARFSTTFDFTKKMSINESVYELIIAWKYFDMVMALTVIHGGLATWQVGSTGYIFPKCAYASFLMRYLTVKVVINNPIGKFERYVTAF